MLQYPISPQVMENYKTRMREAEAQRELDESLYGDVMPTSFKLSAEFAKMIADTGKILAEANSALSKIPLSKAPTELEMRKIILEGMLANATVGQSGAIKSALKNYQNPL